jgi:hypothetical protein
MAAALLAGALASEAAFAHRGGGRGGAVVVGGGGAVVRPGGAFVRPGGAFVRPGGVVVAGGGGKVFVGSRVVVGVGVGPVWWGPGWWGPGWWGPGWWGPGWRGPQSVVVPGSVTYIEQGGGQVDAAPGPEPPGHWWYYCADAKAYYPYVRECPGGWQRVAPQPPPPR